MDNRTIISHIKDNWIVYAFIVQLIATFVLNNADHIQFRKDITELQEYQNSEEILLTEIQKDLSSIKTSILYIERTLK
jgi:hypothetical protein